MKTPSLVAAALVLACSAVGGPTTTTSSFTAAATFNGEKATLRQGLAFWNPARAEANLGFFAAAPDAAARAKAAKEGLCCFDWPTPYLVVDLRFKKGSKKADTAAFESCHIAFLNFKGSPFDFNGFANQCGATALSGDLRPGGMIRGKLKGHSATQAMGPFPANAFDWELEFAAAFPTP